MPGQLAVVQLDRQPAREVIGADRHAPGRCCGAAELVALVQQLLGAGAAEASIHARMRLGAVHFGKVRGRVAGGVQHARWPEQVRLREVLPGLTGHLLDQLAGHHVQHVVVGEAAAEAGGRLDVAQAPHAFRAREVGARHEQQVPRPQAQPASVYQEVTDGDLACHPRVVHLEPGQPVGHLVVPADFPLIDQDPQVRNGEGLAGRAVGEDRVGIHRIVAADGLHAKALGKGDGVALDDGDRHARDADQLAGLLDALREALRRGGQHRGGCGEHGEREDGFFHVSSGRTEPRRNL